MTHILHLDSSARGEASHSRRVSKEFVDAYVQNHPGTPGTTVTYRDIGHDSVPHTTEEIVNASYTPAEARTPAQNDALQLSDALVAELQAADVYVFGVPMYNFGVPSAFKAYIDQIVRPFVTWNPQTYEGLLKGKKLFVITARGGGGYSEGESRAAYNLQDGQIKTVFGLIGVTDIEFVHVENNNQPDEKRLPSLEKAHEKIAQMTA